MPDDDDKPAPIPFTVDVTVDRTRVQVTLLLRPGTVVTVAETKTTTEPGTTLTACEVRYQFPETPVDISSDPAPKF
jgi:hypothetical protein